MRYYQETTETIKAQLNYILNKCSFNHVEGCAQWSIFNYLDNNEIEMALEGMWIEAIAGNIKIPEEHVESLIEFSRIMELDKESVFDDNIWQKIQDFVQTLQSGQVLHLTKKEEDGVE